MRSLFGSFAVLVSLLWINHPVAAQASEPRVPANLIEARQQAKEDVQVRPDRRFVKAAEFIVQKLAANPAKGPVILTAKDGQWLLSVDGQPLGSLSSLPTFDEGFQLLKEIAAKSIKDRTDGAEGRYDREQLSRDLDAFVLDEILTATRTIDTMWNDPQSALPLDLAARASLYMHIQTFDTLGLRDDLSGRALAFMAASDALKDSDDVSSKILLAGLMGYTEEFTTVAAQMKDDPAALYYLKKSNDLLDLGGKSDATTSTWYLALRCLAAANDKDNAEGIINLLQKRKDDISIERHILTFGPVVYNMANWDQRAKMALQNAAFLTAVISGRDPETLSDQALDGSLVPEFVKAVEQLEELSRGPVFDKALHQSLYEIAFANAIDKTMYFFIYEFGDMEQAKSIEKILGTTDKGMLGEYLTVLHTNLHESGNTDKSRDRIHEVIGGLKYVNGSTANTIYYRVASQTDTQYTDPRAIGIDELKVLDSRPDNFERLTRMFTSQGFRDLVALEPIIAAKARPALKSNIADQAKLHYFRGDMDKLMELYNSPGLSVESKAKYIVDYLEYNPDMTTDTRKKMMLELADKNPSNYSVKFYAVRFFEELHDLETAIKIAQRYAESKALASDLSYPHAMCDLASLYADKGDYKRALELTESVAEAYTASALTRMAEYNIALGNYKEGQEWIDKANERYESNSDAFAAEVYSYWLQGKYADAAKTMKNYKKPLTTQILRYGLSKMFLAALGDKPVEERTKAISAIKDAGLGNKLGDMAFWFRSKDRYDLVFEFEKLSTGVGSNKFRGAVLAFNGLRLSKDTTTALEWLNKTIKPEERELLGGIAFRESEYEILDAIVPYDDSTTVGRYNWVLRAAAVCDKDSAKQLMGEKVREYFSSGKYQDFHYLAGQFLVGLKSESDLIAAAKTPHEICQGACYLGLKARRSGDYKLANEWFQAVFTSGSEDLDEYSKAQVIVGNWASLMRSLDVLPEILKTHKVGSLPGM